MVKASTSLPASGMALDSRALEGLKLQASRDPLGNVRQAARQFEAQFAQTLLSQMRQTSLAGQGGLASALNSPAAQTWRSMLDQQMAQTIAGLPAKPGAAVPDKSGLGLADLIERQLNRQATPASDPGKAGVPTHLSTLALARQRARGAAPAADQVMSAVPAGARRVQSGRFAQPVQAAPAVQAMREGKPADAAPAPGSPEEIRAEFLGKFLPAARRAEAATGIPAVYILGQAALESGWGRHEIRGRDGERSFNLFGIKATGWNGRVAEARTTEFRNGRSERVQAKFRAYDSYEQAFEDYARMLASNPRYAGALKQAGSAEQFAQGLQRAGYATDPRYAEKLTSTIRRAMKVVV